MGIDPFLTEINSDNQTYRLSSKLVWMKTTNEGRHFGIEFNDNEQTMKALKALGNIQNTYLRH